MFCHCCSVVETKRVVAKCSINESGLDKLEEVIKSERKGTRTIQYPVKLRWAKSLR